jgi:hypothetical protein
MSSLNVYELDLELLAEIFSYRTPTDIINFCLAFENVYDQLCNRDEFWQRIYLLKRERQDQPPEKILPTGSWKNNVLALSLDLRIGPGPTYVDFSHPLYSLIDAVRDQPAKVNLFYVYLDRQDLNRRLKDYYEDLDPSMTPVYFTDETPIVYTFVGRLPDLEANPYEDVKFLLLADEEDFMEEEIVAGEIVEREAAVGVTAENFYEPFATSLYERWQEKGFPIEYEYYPIHYQRSLEFGLTYDELSEMLKAGDFLATDAFTYITTTSQFEEYLQAATLTERALLV